MAIRPVQSRLRVVIIRSGDEIMHGTRLTTPFVLRDTTILTTPKLHLPVLL